MMKYSAVLQNVQIDGRGRGGEEGGGGGEREGEEKGEGKVGLGRLHIRHGSTRSQSVLRFMSTQPTFCYRQQDSTVC